MNTIDICNILMNSGNKEISMNGRSKSVWSFETETNTLKITGKGIEENHTIADVVEHGEEMLKFFEANKAGIMEKTLETNMKKSQSKLGNQNARKDSWASVYTE